MSVSGDSPGAGRPGEDTTIAGAFFRGPAAGARPSPRRGASELGYGARLAHYKILAAIGSGGMGDVYRAEDQRLLREVALKVLAGGRGAGDAAPLWREARAASALRHPHVAQVYELGEAGGLAFIAMELVEGPTLQARLRRGALPVAEALRIAIELADALAEAHRCGIVHRDIKPSNVLLTARGEVKVVDFGIAQVEAPHLLAADAGAGVDRGGGTALYSSPEQLRGEPLDARTDLFSFGLVLYELLTGEHPFRRADGEATERAIGEDAAPRLARQDLPAGLAAIVERCLAKSPAERFLAADALVAALAEVAAAGGKEAPRSAWLRRGLLAAGLLTLAGLALGALGVATGIVELGFVRSAGGGAAPAAARLVQLTGGPGLEAEPTLSPDGRLLAYVTDERGHLDIAVTPFAGGAVRLLTDDPADDAQPAWSPDGTRLAFVSARQRRGRLSIVLSQALGNFIELRGGDLFVMPADGGPATLLVEDAYYPSWSPDGQRLAFVSSRGGQWDLWTVAADGGEPRQLTADPMLDYQPAWSADGRFLVYACGAPGGYGVCAIPAAGGERSVLGPAGHVFVLRPRLSARGDEVYFSSAASGSLDVWRIGIGANLEARGEPQRLTLGEADDVDVELLPGGLGPAVRGPPSAVRPLRARARFGGDPATHLRDRARGVRAPLAGRRPRALRLRSRR